MVKENPGVKLDQTNKGSDETGGSPVAQGNDENPSDRLNSINKKCEETGVSPVEQESDGNSAEASSQIGAIFSVFRNLFDLTQGDLAEIMGVSSRQVIGNIESGRSKITYDIIYRFISVIEYVLSSASKFNLNFMQVESIKLMKMQLSVYLESSQKINKNKVDNLLKT